MTAVNNVTVIAFVGVGCFFYTGVPNKSIKIDCVPYLFV